MARRVQRAAGPLLLALLALGAAHAAEECKAFVTGAPVRSFTGTAAATIAVDEAFPVSSVGVQVDVQHPRIGALEISLAHDGGDSVVVKADGAGGLGNDLSGASFWDDATDALPTGIFTANATGSFAGKWAPAQPLAPLAATGSAGEWMLTVRDTSADPERRPIDLKAFTLYLCPAAGAAAAFAPAPAPTGALPAESMEEAAPMDGAAAPAPAVVAQSGPWSGLGAVGGGLGGGAASISGIKAMKQAEISGIKRLEAEKISGIKRLEAEKISGKKALLSGLVSGKPGLGKLSKLGAISGLPTISGIKGLELQQLEALLNKTGISLDKGAVISGQQSIISGMNEIPAFGPALKFYEQLNALKANPATYKWLLLSIALSSSVEKSLKVAEFATKKLTALSGKPNPLAESLRELASDLQSATNNAAVTAAEAVSGFFPTLEELPVVGKPLSFSANVIEELASLLRDALPGVEAVSAAAGPAPAAAEEPEDDSAADDDAAPLDGVLRGMLPISLDEQEQGDDLAAPAPAPAVAIRRRAASPQQQERTRAAAPAAPAPKRAPARREP